MGSNCCKSSGKDKLHGGVSSGSSVYLKRYILKKCKLIIDVGIMKWTLELCKVEIVFQTDVRDLKLHNKQKNAVGKFKDLLRKLR